MFSGFKVYVIKVYYFADENYKILQKIHKLIPIGLRQATICKKKPGGYGKVNWI